MKKWVKFCGILLMAASVSGCSVITKSEEGLDPLEYEVVEEYDIPEELQKEIDSQKEKPFRLFYGDQEYLYIAQGYGKAECNGYCIEWKQCAESAEAIYVESILHGPGGEGYVCETEFPYSVIRIKWTQKQVIFCRCDSREYKSSVCGALWFNII